MFTLHASRITHHCSKEITMRKLIAFTALALTAISLIACSASVTPTPKVQPTLAAVKSSGKIVAEGRVVPARSASLGFQVAGVVAQVPVAVGDRVESGKVLAQLDTRQLELQLAQADANLAAAQAKSSQLKRGATPEDLAAAQQALKSAQVSYEKLLKPDPSELSMLKADVDKAKALLDQAQAAYDRAGGDSNPYAGMLPQRAQLQTAWIDYQKALTAYNLKVNPSDAQIQQALSAVQTAKNQLAKLTPAAEDIAAAEANVKASQAARDLAAEQLSRAKLLAPFAGNVASLDLKVGEQVAIGAPVVRLADYANWQVETTDLTEINVVNVKEGDPATVTFDAIPELELTGKVASIKGFGDNKQGDIVYTLVIKLDKQDERLRWNMTAKVSLAK
jgi:HlyD family secretion protein